MFFCLRWERSITFFFLLLPYHRHIEWLTGFIWFLDLYFKKEGFRVSQKLLSPCVVILTALSVEFQAVSAHITHYKKDVRHKTVYWLGTFPCSGCLWKVSSVEIGPSNAIKARGQWRGPWKPMGRGARRYRSARWRSTWWRSARREHRRMILKHVLHSIF